MNVKKIKTIERYERIQEDFDLFPGYLKEFCKIRGYNYNTMKQHVKTRGKRKKSEYKKDLMKAREDGVISAEALVGEEVAKKLTESQEDQLENIIRIDNITSKVTAVVKEMLDKELATLDFYWKRNKSGKLTEEEKDKLEQTLIRINLIFKKMEGASLIILRLAGATKNLATLFGSKIELSAELKKKIDKYKQQAEDVVTKYGYKKTDGGQIVYDKDKKEE
jgi:hypothetical protein